jgi:hypothetical protein
MFDGEINMSKINIGDKVRIYLEDPYNYYKGAVGVIYDKISILESYFTPYDHEYSLNEIFLVIFNKDDIDEKLSDRIAVKEEDLILAEWGQINES